jgi:hypothetical protein
LCGRISGSSISDIVRVLLNKVTKCCTKCGLTKLIKEFYIRKSGDRAGKPYQKCKTCMKIRGRSYYHKNKKRQLALALIRNRRSYFERRALINRMKNVPCQDCNQRYPYFVMDFDHRVKADKFGDIAHMVRNRSWDTIIREIKKCDIVCANCHRIRTFGRYAELAKVVTAGA